MCTYSMVAQQQIDRWATWGQSSITTTPPTREEFDQLRLEILEMKVLLQEAREDDKRNGEPDCENGDKVEKLRAIARIAGFTDDEIDNIIGSDA